MQVTAPSGPREPSTCAERANHYYARNGLQPSCMPGTLSAVLALCIMGAAPNLRAAEFVLGLQRRC